MRIHLLPATLVASLFVCGIASAQAQAAADGGVAVIDISLIFKSHERFKASMEQMKADVEGAEKALQGERERIQAMMENLKLFQAESVDYKRKEEEILHAQTEFNVRASKQKKDFLDREARIYHTVYAEINDAVAAFATQYNVSLVLRHSSDPVDPADRGSVLKAINRPIVFVGPQRDITKNIIEQLNRGGPAPGGIARPPVSIQR